MATPSLFETLRNHTTTEPGWVKIPWDDPEFSRRMLHEHLTQQHDRASRRFTIIDQQVDWIHRKVLGGKSAAILDLGCGPGLYMDRLTRLGHTCTGIDFSPASIAYAKEHHAGTYRQGNILSEDYGTGYDLVMLLYGELNAFDTPDAQRIVDKAYEALRPGGRLLIEVSDPGNLRRAYRHARSWYTAQSGLFSDRPHLVLEENSYEMGCFTTHIYVQVEGQDEIDQYTSMHRIYSDDEYRYLLRAFEHVLVYDAIRDRPGDEVSEPRDLFGLLAIR